MEDLLIKHKVHTVFRKGMGIFTIILGVLWVVIYFFDMSWWRGLFGLFYIAAGIAYYIGASGSDISEVHVENDFIKIRWVNWYKPKIIRYSEIENLTFTMFDIVISKKDQKPVKLRLDFMEIVQMKEVREYFLKLAAEKGLKYENRYRK